MKSSVITLPPIIVIVIVRHRIPQSQMTHCPIGPMPMAMPLALPWSHANGKTSNSENKQLVWHCTKVLYYGNTTYVIYACLIDQTLDIQVL